MTSTVQPALHRGVCVENRDPLGMGRIRVQVPALLGAGASGWAFPAWTGDDTNVWPRDRLPDPGEGVWVGFESADRMTWTAIFGPVKGPVSDGPEMYVTSIWMTVDVLPENIPTPMQGRLTSPSGTPNPEPIVVHLEKSQDYVPASPGVPGVAGTWAALDSATVALDGRFALEYSRPTGEDDWWYRAKFNGREPFTACTSIPGQSRNAATVITWNAARPVWQRAVTYSGTLVAGDGADMAGKTVGVLVNDGSGWKAAATTVCTTGGAWSLSWTQPYAMTGPISMSAVFDGDEVYDTSITPVQQWPAVTVPTSITWTPPVFDVQQLRTVTGTLTSTDYGIPEPGRSLDFMVRPTGQAWSVAARTDANATTGAFSFTYTANQGICDYKMAYLGSGVFQASESSVSSQANSVYTTVSAPTIEPTLYHGTGHTVSGTVTDQTGARAKYGSLVLEQRRSDAGNTWAQVPGTSTATVSANGTWSVAVPALGFVGPVEYRGNFTGSGNGFYLPSVGAAGGRTVGLRAMGTLSKGGMSHTSASFSWAAVSGATHYELYHQPYSGGPWNYWTTTTATSAYHGGLGHDSFHGYLVYALRQQSGGAWTYSAGSPGIYCHTGHPEQRASGSFSNAEWAMTCRSWRSGTDGGWGPWGSFASPDQVIQGTYSGRSYDGVMKPDQGAFQNWIRNNWGQHVLDHMKANNGVWSQCAIYLYRVRDAGSTTGAINFRWCVTDAIPGSTGGPHNYAGGDTGPGSLAHDSGKWFYLQPHWAGHVLFNEWVGGMTIQSFMIEYDSTSHYLRCYGSASGYPHGHLSVSASWNFVTVNYAAPFWY